MQVITLNKETFVEKCTELFSKLEIQPDLVVGILNGGGFLLNEIKKQKKFGSVRLLSLNLQRTKGFRNLFFIRFILKKLPYKILNTLRIYESKKARKSIIALDINGLLNYQIDFDSTAIQKESIKTILIIDDAIDTGRTMFIVKNNLKARFPTAQIRTAVMSWTIETSIEKPDYYLFKNVLVRYPWSKDYKQKDGE